MNMAEYGTRLIKRETVAEVTMAFHFTRPSGLQFRAGQSADLTLVHPPETDAEGDTRTFSIASPPFEDELLFVTRMRNTAFKRTLGSTALGTVVQIGDAMGSFALHKNAAKPGVLLAGGIGITPFLSIVRQAARDKSGHQLYLFYANRRPEDAAYLDSLQEVAAGHPGFRCIPTMTAVAKSHASWTGETGRITREMLARYLSTLQGPIYYLAGPPGMVAATRAMLVQAGVDDDDIRSEEFGGY
jgi:ferredoxin-NADP reductase